MVTNSDVQFLFYGDGFFIPKSDAKNFVESVATMVKQRILGRELKIHLRDYTQDSDSFGAFINEVQYLLDEKETRGLLQPVETIKFFSDDCKKSVVWAADKKTE